MSSSSVPLSSQAPSSSLTVCSDQQLVNPAGEATGDPCTSSSSSFSTFSSQSEPPPSSFQGPVTNHREDANAIVNIDDSVVAADGGLTTRSGDQSTSSPAGAMMKSICTESLSNMSEKAEDSKKESRRKRLLRKAPDAPKRFKSAYICYVIEKMDEVKKTLADDVKVTEAMKILALMWRELPPETKMEYQKMAEDDKSRYFAEMKDYTGPMHVPNKRQKKPAGAPKRAMSAFLSFSQQMRPQVRAKYPDLKNTDISGVLAQLWREGTEEEKAPHINRELREREKYHEDMARWKEEVSQQAEIDAIAAAQLAEATKKKNALLGSTSASGGASLSSAVVFNDDGRYDMNQFPPGNIVPIDNYGNDFLQNVWMDGALNESGWSEVDKLLQDVDADDITGTVRQDFFGGGLGNRGSSRDQCAGIPTDVAAAHASLHQDQTMPRALTPSSSFDASGLLSYTSTYNENSIFDTRREMTSANMNSNQSYMQYNNQKNNQMMQQQYQYPEQYFNPNRQDDMYSLQMQRQQQQFMNTSSSTQQRRQEEEEQQQFQEQQRRLVMMQHQFANHGTYPLPMRPFQPESMSQQGKAVFAADRVGVVDPFYKVPGSVFSADQKQSPSSSPE